MVPLDLVKLTGLMRQTSGHPEVMIGLVDGPVVTHHPDLVGEYLREIPGQNGGTCAQTNSTVCLHRTFVAGILSAKRSSPAPAVCPTTAPSLSVPSFLPKYLQVLNTCPVPRLKNLRQRLWTV